jgi:hypothetical protein
MRALDFKRSLAAVSDVASLAFAEQEFPRDKILTYAALQ